MHNRIATAAFPWGDDYPRPDCTRTSMANISAAAPGLEIAEISADAFRNFARRFGSSPEIGPIGTYLDKGDDGAALAKARLLGLLACGNLRAVCCFTLDRSRTSETYSCKLDSVIVHSSIRRQRLASLLVAHGFGKLVEAKDKIVSTVYAHAVHPATIKLLRSLSFSEPNLVGAPICALAVDSSTRDGFVARLKTREHAETTGLKLKCVQCIANRKGAVPWCKPDEA